MRRLFFALWPDEALRSQLRTATREAVAAAGGTPVPPANFHITLAFLGSVPGEAVPRLTAASAGLVLPSATIVLDRYGYFRRPEVFWLGPSAEQPAFAAFVRGLWTRILSAGYPWRAEAPAMPPDFRPHLTLCRKVRRQPVVAPPQPISWTPSGFVLVESVTDPAGARYEVIERFGSAA